MKFLVIIRADLDDLHNPLYIVYISACNPYPERDLGWNSGQMQEIVHNQNLYDELGLNNTRCLKEKQLRTSTRFETRDADSSNLGTETDIDRWERHYEGIYDSEYAEMNPGGLKILG